MGVILDEKLNWSGHINSLVAQLATISGIIYKARCFLSRCVLWNIYNALFYSKMNYLITVYGAANKTRLKPLFILQKRVLKTILNLPRTYPSIELFIGPAKSTVPIKALYWINLNMLKFKILHEHIHNNTQLRLIQTEPNTRSTQQEYLQIIRTYMVWFGDASFEYNGPKEFNKLPQEIRSETNKSYYKKKDKHTTNLHPKLLEQLIINELKRIVNK